jgi:hypothetical protein
VVCLFVCFFVFLFDHTHRHHCSATLVVCLFVCLFVCFITPIVITVQQHLWCAARLFVCLFAAQHCNGAVVVKELSGVHVHESIHVLTGTTS